MSNESRDWISQPDSLIRNISCEILIAVIRNMEKYIIYRKENEREGKRKVSLCLVNKIMNNEKLEKEKNFFEDRHLKTLL